MGGTAGDPFLVWVRTAGVRRSTLDRTTGADISYPDMSPPKTVPALRRPFSPAVLHILLALTDGPRHGYAIKQEAELRSNGLVRLKPGTLYEAIHRLLDTDLVRERTSESDPANGQEAQRRYYELTARGRRVLREEVQHLGQLVDYAHGKLELA